MKKYLNQKKQLIALVSIFCVIGLVLLLIFIQSNKTERFEGKIYFNDLQINNQLNIDYEKQSVQDFDFDKTHIFELVSGPILTLEGDDNLTKFSSQLEEISLPIFDKVVEGDYVTSIDCNSFQTTDNQIPFSTFIYNIGLEIDVNLKSSIEQTMVSYSKEYRYFEGVKILNMYEYFINYSLIDGTNTCLKFSPFNLDSINLQVANDYSLKGRLMNKDDLSSLLVKKDFFIINTSSDTYHPFGDAFIEKESIDLNINEIESSYAFVTIEGINYLTPVISMKVINQNGNLFNSFVPIVKQ